MQVENHLAAMLVAIHDEPKAVLGDAFLLRNVTRHDEHVTERAFVVFGDVNTDVDTTREPSSYITFVKCDVTKYDDLYHLFKQTHEKHGRIDHAISCAGIFEHGNWFDPNQTIESIKHDPGNTKTLDVNLMGTLYFSRIAAVFLRETKTKRDNKSLTLLSSVNAFRDSPGLYLYQTSKHAIQGLMRSFRKTLYERDGIRVNAVAPGTTRTRLGGDVLLDSPELVQSLGQGVAFGRIGEPEDAARVIVFLLSDEAAWITGQVIEVSGGQGL